MPPPWPYNGINMKEVVGEIPHGDWEVYSHLRDLPLTLWCALCWGDLPGSTRADSITGLVTYRRVKIKTVEGVREMDSRLIARLYRSWWARLYFIQHTGVTLRKFVERTERWPRKALGKKRPEPVIILSEFIEAVRKRRQRADFYTFNRLSSGVVRLELDGSDLRYVDPRSIDRLIEYGNIPTRHESMLAAMMHAYLQDPRTFKGVPELLCDVFLPDFKTDEGDGVGYDDGRIAVVKGSRSRARNKVVAGAQP
jgi:hypothetical protein